MTEKDTNRPLKIQNTDIKISTSEKKIKNIYPYQKDKINLTQHCG